MQTVIETPYKFPVALQPLFTQSGVKIPRARTIVRTDTDTPLSIVSDKYHLITHEEALDRVAPFTHAFGEAKVGHVLERNGARLITQFTYRNQNIQIPSVGDTVALRVSVLNSYDSKHPLSFKIGALVLRCLNGMSALSGEFAFRWRHVGTTNIEEIELPDPEKVFERFTAKGKTWDTWAQTEITRDQAKSLVQRLVGLGVMTVKQAQLREQDLYASKTLWALYDQMTYALTHEAKRIRESERLRRLDALDFAFSTARTEQTTA